MKKQSFELATLLATIAIVVGCGNSFAAPAKSTAKHPAQRPQVTTAAPKGSGLQAPPGQLNAAYTSYLSRLRGKLDRNWYLADGRNKVTISAKLAADGSVTELNIASTPKNVQAEQAATDAFNSSQPLEALPATSGEVKLILEFTSFADPHGDNNRSINARIEELPKTATGGAAPGNTDTASSQKE